jgi:hypothetical protein
MNIQNNSIPLRSDVVILLTIVPVKEVIGNELQENKAGSIDRLEAIVEALANYLYRHTFISVSSSSTYGKLVVSTLSEIFIVHFEESSAQLLSITFSR